ncbi:glycosyltransferase [Massilia aurea]|uniref:glycosyltransferase n=1 Tax=Massilia aurea TaxID=373040 RepID=UPI000F2DE60C|nr:glycosyltransferase [Massilia aurea]
MTESNDPSTSEHRANSNKAVRYAGHFDGIFGRLAMGWAYNVENVNEVIQVEVVFDGRVVANTTASHFREDLAANGIGTGNHHFKCLLPIELFDGQARQIHVRIKGIAINIPGGPHIINKKLASLNDAFDGTSLNASPPLSDFQVAMFRGLTAACETLSEHTKLLQNLAIGQRQSTPFALNAASNLGGAADLQICVYSEEFKKIKNDETIIVFSIIDWHFRTQRPQHMAENFAKMGRKVIYVSVHLEERISNHTSFSYLRSKPTHGVYEAVLRCTGQVPSIYSGIEDPNTLNELCQGMEELLLDLKIQNPTVVIQYPTWYPIASSIPGAKIVFDCMDHLAGFSTAGPQVIAMEHELVAHSDGVVTSSHYLSEVVSKVRPTTIIRNAAEVEFFGTHPVEQKIYAEKHIIGYYGAIAEWFDVDLVEYVAKNRPQWKFLLIGSTSGANVERLKELPNVEFTGEIPYRQIPSYLYAFNCAIIPFKLTELIKATNPVKLYEYFSAGKPVVATDIPELKVAPQELIGVAKDKEQFIKKIERALNESELNKERRRLWASQHSWAVRARDFLVYCSKLSPRVSVVVLCYNSIELTKACLSSIEKYSSYENLEIIVVDNASSDDTAAYLQFWADGRENVKIILNRENQGFAAGNNIGMSAATGEYIILLNNDTFVTEGWVRDLIRPMILDSSIGLTGPLTNMIGNEQKINIHYSTMEQMASASRKFTRRRKRDLFETDNLAFFCVGIRRSLVEKIGMLDTRYGLGYFEDDDYCRQTFQAGYRIVVVDGVFVHHHLSGSFNKNPELRQQLISENKKKFEEKWGTWYPHTYRNQSGFGE